MGCVRVHVCVGRASVFLFSSGDSRSPLQSELFNIPSCHSVPPYIVNNFRLRAATVMIQVSTYSLESNDYAHMLNVALRAVVPKIFTIY